MDRTVLEKQIRKGSLSGVYFFTGEEEYLKQKTVADIEKKLLPAGFETLNESILENPDIATLFDCAMALPFMCEKRLVVARDPDFMFVKKNKKDEEGNGEAESNETDNEAEPEETEDKKQEKELRTELKEKLNKLNTQNPSCIVIIYIRTGIKKTLKSLKTLLDADKGVSFENQSYAELKKWIVQECKQAGMRINDDAIAELIQDCSSSMNAIKSELEKLTAYRYGFSEIRAEDVRARVEPDPEENVFKMIEYAFQAKPAIAYTTLAGLLEHNAAPMMIVSLLSKQLRLMCYAKTISEKISSYAAIADLLELPPKNSFQVDRALKLSRPFTANKLRNLYKRSVDTEADIKSGKIGDRQGLDIMMQQICAAAEK